MLELIVNNPARPEPEVAMTEPEREAECRGVLVGIGKQRPRRVVVMADLGGGEMMVWRSTMTPKEMRAFADSALELMFNPQGVTP